MEFVVASHNRKKIGEMDAILGALGISFLPLPQGAPEPVEDGAAFEENALIKARAACAFTGKPAVADDSGLCVDALGGAPGIYSARYCEGSDSDRNAFLLENLAAVPDGGRQAQFVSAVACVFPSGEALVVRGECAGEIVRSPQGEGAVLCGGVRLYFRTAACGGQEPDFPPRAGTAKNETGVRRVLC